MSHSWTRPASADILQKTSLTSRRSGPVLWAPVPAREPERFGMRFCAAFACSLKNSWRKPRYATLDLMPLQDSRSDNHVADLTFDGLRHQQACSVDGWSMDSEATVAGTTPAHGTTRRIRRPTFEPMLPPAGPGQFVASLQTDHDQRSHSGVLTDRGPVTPTCHPVAFGPHAVIPWPAATRKRLIGGSLSHDYDPHVLRKRRPHTGPT